jgi:hypothetical protein
MHCCYFRYRAIIDLMMEAVSPFETTSVNIYHSSWCNVLEHIHLHIRGLEYVKPHKSMNQM